MGHVVAHAGVFEGPGIFELVGGAAGVAGDFDCGDGDVLASISYQLTCLILPHGFGG